MKALYIAYYTALRNIRDYRNLTTMIALPVVLMLILGYALAGTFQIENMDPVKVVVVNENEGQLLKNLKEYLRQENIKEVINVDTVENFDMGMDKIKEGKAFALIHVKAAEEGKIQVYKREESEFRSSVVKNVLDSFIQYANAEYACSVSGGINGDTIPYETVVEEVINPDGKRPKGLDYYAAAMLIMTMMYGTANGASAMAEERFYKTEIRLKSAPLHSYEVFTGKVAGTILTLVFDAVIILLFTKYVYNVNWGDNMLFIMFTCFTLAVLATSIGVAGFMLIGDENKTQALLSILVPVLTFLGGGYMPYHNMSFVIKKFSILSPNYLGLRIMINTIYEGNKMQVKNYMAILWTISLVLFLVSAFKGRRDLA